MTWPPPKLESSTVRVSAETGTTSRGHASSVSLTILGQIYSMKNSKTPRRYGRGMVKHPKARKFEADFALQVPVDAKVGLGSMKHPLRAIITAYYPSWRQDLDLSIAYDLLQSCGVVSNDRWIREKHEWAHVDPENPRVEILIEEI